MQSKRARPIVQMMVLLAAASTAAIVPRHALAADDEFPQARRLSAIEVIVDQRGLFVSLAGNGRLSPSVIYEVEHGPPRLVVELSTVTAEVPDIMPIGMMSGQGSASRCSEHRPIDYPRRV